MWKKKKVLFIGGDERQAYAVAQLRPYTLETFTYKVADCSEQSLQKALQKAQVVVLPMPASKEHDKLNVSREQILLKDFFAMPQLQGKEVFLGNANDTIRKYAKENNILYTDYYGEQLAYLNAIPTAEGAIAILIDKRKETLFGAKVLLTGFGKVAKILANRLHALGAKVCIAARGVAQLGEAAAMGYDTKPMAALACHEDYRIVINTPNAPIFTKQQVARFPKDTLFLELASLPGGFQFDTKAFQNIVFAPSLPGKVAPKTAGKYIAQTIAQYVKGE